MNFGCVEELPEMVKLSRECALLGDYERSEKLYQDCISLGEEQFRICSRNADRDSKETRLAMEKWRKVTKVLGKELAMVSKFRSMLHGGPALSTPAPRKSRSNNDAPDLSFGRASPPSRQHQAADEDVPVWKRPAQRQQQQSSSNNILRGKGPTSRGAPQSSGGGRPSGARSGAGKSKDGRRTAESGRKGGNGQNGEKMSYADYMGNSPDIELIRSIESTMLTHSLNVRSEDIAGLKGAKAVLDEAVLYPQLMPQYYTGIRRPWKGVLLFGPPGTGKTMLAKAIASECKTCFFNVASSSLTSKWRGESEKMVGILFDMARYYAPSTIFFDEIDSIASARGGATEHEASRRVKSELLTQMDGVSNESDKTVVVLAATNLPWDLDDAIRRRLEKRIYIPLPDIEGRVGLFQIATREVNISSDVNFQNLAELSEGYSGADITNVCHEASMMPIRRLIEDAKRSVVARGGGRTEMYDMMKELGENQSSSPPVSHQDFVDALSKVSSSVGGRDLSKYQEWLDEYGAV